jgi:hypothetical protein
MIGLYKRHVADCEHKDEPQYKRCHCPVWFQTKRFFTHPVRRVQASYSHAIDEFIGWYSSEPRLSFNRTVVLRYWFLLEQGCHS